MATVEFSKVFDSVRYPALYLKRNAGLPPCFVRTQSFFSNISVHVVFKNTEATLSESVVVFRKELFLTLLYSLYIPMTFGPSSSYSQQLFLRWWRLQIWFSYLVQVAQNATYNALQSLEKWSQYWRLPLNPKRCEVSFFSTNTHLAQIQPMLFLSVSLYL